MDEDITKYPIYTTSTANNSVQYRFAFVPSEHGSGTNVAVILGANTSNVKNNTLSIDSKVDAFKKLLDRLALMGYNMAMMYTEDTVKLEGLPYFGYMRGAYTKEEIREMDDYAFEYGI